MVDWKFKAWNVIQYKYYYSRLKTKNKQKGTKKVSCIDINQHTNKNKFALYLDHTFLFYIGTNKKFEPRIWQKGGENDVLQGKRKAQFCIGHIFMLLKFRNTFLLILLLSKL